MAAMTLPELSKKIADIDFCMFETRAETGDIAARPMSNNGDVEYTGDSHFFTGRSRARSTTSSVRRRWG